LAEFYKNCWQIGRDIKYKDWPGITHQFYRRLLDLRFDDVYPFLKDATLLNTIDSKNLKTLSSSISCGFNYGCLKMRYDGTLIICHIAMTAVKEEELKNKTDADSMVLKRRL
jgi:hypothetical protein